MYGWSDVPLAPGLGGLFWAKVFYLLARSLFCADEDDDDDAAVAAVVADVDEDVGLVPPLILNLNYFLL